MRLKAEPLNPSLLKGILIAPINMPTKAPKPKTQKPYLSKTNNFSGLFLSSEISFSSLLLSSFSFSSALLSSFSFSSLILSSFSFSSSIK